MIISHISSRQSDLKSVVSFFPIASISWSPLTREFMRQSWCILLSLESFYTPFPPCLGYHILVASDGLARAEHRGTAVVAVMHSPATMCHSSTPSNCHSQAKLNSLSAEHSLLCCVPGWGQWCDHTNTYIVMMAQARGTSRHYSHSHRKSKPPFPHDLIIYNLLLFFHSLEQICSCPLGLRSSSTMSFSVTSCIASKISSGNVTLDWLNDK